MGSKMIPESHTASYCGSGKKQKAKWPVQAKKKFIGVCREVNDLCVAVFSCFFPLNCISV